MGRVKVQLVPAATRCRGCGARIVWRLSGAGRPMPMNPDGTSHFATCPDAAAFRRWRRRREARAEISAAVAAGAAGQGWLL